MVSVLEALLAGAVQGLVEWLPVSSEGNLVLLLTKILGVDPSTTLRLAVFLHIGTGVSALIYLRRDVTQILLGRTATDRSMRMKLIIITGLTGAVGLPVFLFLNVSAAYGEALLGLTGLALLVTGLMQRNRSMTGQKTGGELSWQETVSLGIAQGLAIIPGLSRSGVTTSILLFRGFSGEEAFRFSFLMSIPASFAAGFGLMFLGEWTLSVGSVAGLVSAAAVGYFSMEAMLGFAKSTSLWKLCVALGALALASFLPTLISAV